MFFPQLLNACHDRDGERVKKLLASGLDPNQRNKVHVCMKAVHVHSSVFLMYSFIIFSTFEVPMQWLCDCKHIKNVHVCIKYSEVSCDICTCLLII